MYQWDKLVRRIMNMFGDIRFEELKRILENYGYELCIAKRKQYMFGMGSVNYDFKRLREDLKEECLAEVLDSTNKNIPATPSR